MSNISVDYDILNQKQTPAFYASSLATRPAFGFPGRIFIDTDTPSSGIYRDTGSAWVQVADPGAGTTGTLQQVTTNGNTTTQGIVITTGNLAIGTPTASAPLDIHEGTLGQLIQLNATSTNNSNIAFLNGNVGKWRIGNVYNAGANDFVIYDISSALSRLTINTSTGISTFNSTANTSLVLNSSSAIGTYLEFYNSNILYGKVYTYPSLNRLTIGTYFTGGNVTIEVDNNVLAATFDSTKKLTLTGDLAGVNSVFTGNITGSSLIKSGGTAAQILAANGSVITAGTNITISGGTISSTGVTLSAIGSTPNANAATLTGSVLNLEPASASFGGVVTTGTQSFAGAKTFTSDLNINKSAATFTIASTNSYGVLSFTNSGTGGNIVVNSTPLMDIQCTTIKFTDSAGANERGRFSSGGNFLIGSTTDDTANKLQVTGNTKITGLAGTGSRAVLADASGVLSAPVSDISVKENISTIGYGLNEILKMNPIWFNYNDQYKNYGEGRQNGNIAQEMEAIIPEAVFTTPSNSKMGINYDQLHAVYIKAIQELNEKLERNNIN